MDSNVLLAIALVCGTAFATSIGAMVVLMGGFYFTTAMQQTNLNEREHLRTQKALAKIELEREQSGEGGNDLMSLAVQALPVIQGLFSQRKAPEQEPVKEDDLNGSQS